MKDARFYIRLFKTIIFALCKDLSFDRTASNYTKIAAKTSRALDKV